MTVHPLNGASTGSVTKVLGPKKGTDYSAGVGTPQVVNGPNGDKILFTGWPNAAGNNRHLFVADINNALEVSNVQKIIDAAVFGRVDGAYGFYDAEADRWLIGVGQNTTGVYLFEFASDFTSYNSYNFGQDPKDCGVNAIGAEGGALWLSWTAQSNGNIVLGKVTADITAVSSGGFGTSFSGIKTLQYGTPYLSPDVNNIFYGTAGLTCLSEYWGSNKDQWKLHPSFVGSTDTTAPDNMALVSTQPLLQSSLQGGGDNYGMPHFTTQLGRPLLFFAYFRDLVSGLNTHEIWAIEPEYNILTPSEWFPLRGRPINGGSGPSDNFMTHGAEKAVLMVDSGSSSGEFYIREAPSSSMMNAGQYAETVKSISTGTSRSKFVIDQPLYAMQVAANFGTNYVDVMLR